MVAKIALLLVLFVSGCSDLRPYLKTMIVPEESSDFDGYVYAVGSTEPVQKIAMTKNRNRTMYLDRVLAYSADTSYKGGGIGMTDEEGFGMLRVDILKSDPYQVSQSKKSLSAPQGVKISNIDLGGVKVGELTSVTKRTEWIIHPQLSVPITSLRYHSHFTYQGQPVRKGLQILFEPRIGLGWAFHHYFDNTTYIISLLDSKGEKIKLPFTDDFGEDFFTANAAANANLGFAHASIIGTIDTRYHTKLALLFGANWQ